MFFQNFLFSLFLKFLWLGLVLGVFKMFCSLICKMTRNNIFIVNVVNFCFWSVFSLFFTYFCVYFYSFSFCWFGFLAMLAGIYFVKISVEICFTNLLKLLYNKLDKKPRGKKHGKFWYDKKV